MKPLIDQVLGDVLEICGPLGVEVVRELRYGVPSRVTVQVRGEGDSCEVVLYSGAFSTENEGLGSDLDGRLIRLLSKAPYALIEHTRGVAFGNAYKVALRRKGQE